MSWASLIAERLLDQLHMRCGYSLSLDFHIATAGTSQKCYYIVCNCLDLCSHNDTHKTQDWRQTNLFNYYLIHRIKLSSPLVYIWCHTDCLTTRWTANICHGFLESTSNPTTRRRNTWITGNRSEISPSSALSHTCLLMFHLITVSGPKACLLQCNSNMEEPHRF